MTAPQPSPLVETAQIRHPSTIEASNNFLKTVDICWKPWEVQSGPIDTAYWIGNHLNETTNLRFPTSGLDLSQVFACHMTVLESSECFLSNTTNNMHILASATE